ncbi:hypothetical protein G5V59_11425 [Nocardioides sp. W3-2-3]|uniref:hypothetical protein n=1 Tax=Nocardioides convexus TaxID=2712224 RepID=UPI0024185D80|nr:hypothetical protein [Nocardioides convexus]NHA00456.1 hypothetical protein [Nocardioides convexus]
MSTETSPDAQIPDLHGPIAESGDRGGGRRGQRRADPARPARAHRLGRRRLLPRDRARRPRRRPRPGDPLAARAAARRARLDRRPRSAGHRGLPTGARAR